MKAVEILSALYEVSRCYVNFFQPSFKLKSKTRHGAKVTKRYHAPATPYHRLLASDQISESIKQQLQAAFAALDPVPLLQQIRSRQQELVTAEESPSAEPKSGVTTETFLQSLRTAWQEGEVRPTQRKRKRAPRTWRTKPDPFAAVWPRLLEQRQARPEACAKDLFQQLPKEHPGVFPDSQLRTRQRRVKQWRSEIARRLIMSSEETRLPVFALSAPPTAVQD
jgi:DNA polymerase III gamma/tau subunit